MMRTATCTLPTLVRCMTWARLTFIEELLGAARVVLPVVVAGAAGVRRHAQYGRLADL